MKSCVINIKTAFETGRQSLWFKHQCTHECRGPIPAFVQDIGQVWEGLAQWIAHVIQVIELRVRSG
jgi:hypothetical protein